MYFGSDRFLLLAHLLGRWRQIINNYSKTEKNVFNFLKTDMPDLPVLLHGSADVRHGNDTR